MISISFETLESLHVLNNVLNFHSNHTDRVNLVFETKGVTIKSIQLASSEYSQDPNIHDSLYTSNSLEEGTLLIKAQSFISANFLKSYKCSSMTIQGVILADFQKLVKRIMAYIEDDRRTENDRRVHEVSFFISDYEPSTYGVLVLSRNDNSSNTVFLGLDETKNQITQKLFKICSPPHNLSYSSGSRDWTNKIDKGYDFVLEVPVSDIRRICCKMLGDLETFSDPDQMTSDTWVNGSEVLGKRKRGEEKGKGKGKETQKFNFTMKVRAIPDKNIAAISLSAFVSNPTSFSEEIVINVKSLLSTPSFFTGSFCLNSFISCLPPSSPNFSNICYDKVRLYVKKDSMLLFSYLNSTDHGMKTELLLERCIANEYEHSDC